MAKNFTPLTRQPSIVKYSQSERMGIQSQMLTRHAVGFVLKGRKLIFYGDVAHEVRHGDLFYLGAGTHYMENIPENNRAFEQIVFYFSPEQLGRCLTLLSVNCGLNISEHHSCDNCRGQKHVVYPAWPAMRGFFSSMNQYIRDGILPGEPTAEIIKMMELIYLIVTNPDCCIQNNLLEHSDILRESFEQIVHNNIFTDASIEDLARETNRSLTSFKKEFKRQFFESPHKWMIKQRLMHARLLLISTGKPIAEVGTECNFPNTSHFIKLFKKEFGLTPSVYRHRHKEERTPQVEKEPKKECS